MLETKEEEEDARNRGRGGRCWKPRKRRKMLETKEEEEDARNQGRGGRC